jgi:hypothetical protein
MFSSSHFEAKTLPGGKVRNEAGRVIYVLFLYLKLLSIVNSLDDMRIREAIMFDMTYTFAV